MILFWASVLGCLCMVVVFENLSEIQGLLSDENTALFVFTFIMELITICIIPLSLRLFRFRKIADDLKQRGVAALNCWGKLRMCLLVAPMWMNVVFYYMFMNTTFGYMAIILLLCMAFVYPSLSRCQSEIE